MNVFVPGKAMSDQVEETKETFIAKLREKRRLFAAEAKTEEEATIMADLELLESSLGAIAEENFTQIYIQTIKQKYPALSALTLSEVSRGRTPTKVTRRRSAPVRKCGQCGSPLSDGTCSSCGSKGCTSSISCEVQTKGKATGDLDEKMKQFESDLNILLAITPLPPDVAAKKDLIVASLQKAGVRIARGVPIHTDTMRKAFTSVDLRQHYIWCNAMVYAITEWKPTPFEPSERSLLREYYNRAIQGFFRRMNRSTGDKSRMSNLWCIQAIINMILLSSPALRRSHDDFRGALHRPNEGTVESHCRIWNEMVSTDKWTFV